MLLYTEIESRLIYEVQFHDDHVLIRPLYRNAECPIDNLSHAEFACRFDEFCGDRDKVYEILGLEGEEIVVDD